MASEIAVPEPKMFLRSKTNPEYQIEIEWTNAFFKEMPENEFKELCWKADYLDSQRFLEAAGDFVMAIMEEMEVKQIQEYLNIVDDYTPEERKAMEEHPLEFFTGVSIQQDEDQQQQQAQAAGDAQ
uniref:SKP1 component dimerisation domain-containing protein n=1 Tax=Panagrolaimus davidi TaxID=227884 RepID=A0A914PSM3_9BILA